MGRAGGAYAMLGRLLLPEHVAISEVERKLTATRISDASASGRISQAYARELLERLPTAGTRADLKSVLDGVPGATTPPSLLAVTRIAIAVWAVASVVQLIVWALICLISGNWGDPWWMWWVIGGGAIVGGLWWTSQRDDRGRVSDGDEPSRL